MHAAWPRSAAAMSDWWSDARIFHVWRANSWLTTLPINAVDRICHEEPRQSSRLFITWISSSPEISAPATSSATVASLSMACFYSYVYIHLMRPAWDPRAARQKLSLFCVGRLYTLVIGVCLHKYAVGCWHDESTGLWICQTWDTTARYIKSVYHLSRGYRRH